MLIPTTFCQVNLRFGGPNLPLGAEITMGLDHDASGLTPLQVGETVYNLFQAQVLPYLNVGTSMIGARVKFGPNTLGPTADYVESAAGSATGEALPPNVGLLIKKRTALGGRRNRGRWFLPGLDEDMIDQGGYVDPPNIAALNDNLELFLDGLTTANLPMCVLHTEPPELPVSTVTSLTVDARAATQRRRLRR